MKSQREKNALLASVAHIVTRDELWESGWKFTKNTFTRVRKNQHLRPRPPPPHALAADLKKAVANFFEKVCLPSGGKKFVKKGLETQALFYDDTLLSLWKRFLSENPQKKISYPSFCKLRPKHCVRTEIRTDVCPKCKLLKSIEKKRTTSEEDKSLVKTLLKHRESAVAQREKFKSELEELETHLEKGIVIIDFKENIRFWKSKEQDADSFRNNLISTIFNASVFVFRNERLEAHNWTFCSNNLTHDSFFVKEALRQMFETNEFKSLKIESISFWMDGGPHFRSHEFNCFFLDLFRSKKFKEVNWNHFVEYHGKNYCDSHFSVVSYILKVKERQIEDPLTSISQVVETLEEGFKKIEENRKDLKRKREFEGTTHVLEWESIERPAKVPRIKIPGFKEFYSFRIQGNSQIEAFRPLVKLQSLDRSPYYEVKKITEFTETFSIRRTEKKEKRSSFFSTFREKRHREIQIRRNIPSVPSLNQVVCVIPMM